MLYFLSVGALNVLVNVAVKIVRHVTHTSPLPNPILFSNPAVQIHVTCAVLILRIYRRASSNEHARQGKTFSTDSSDVVPEAWIGGHKLRRCRTLSPWATVLLLIMVLLIPMELLLEAGIGESRTCTPRTDRDRKGICASPMEDGGYSLQKNGSSSEIFSQMVLIQNIPWVDNDWDFVPVGASKKPQADEVRISANARQGNRSFVVADCRVRTGVCKGSNCGAVTVTTAGGVFKTVVRKWSVQPRRGGHTWERGDLTYDKSVATIFIFREAESRLLQSFPTLNRSRIRVIGVEKILSPAEVARFQREEKGAKEDYVLPISAERSRTYDISCLTDGLQPRDLARAVSLYRTAIMEQPGVVHDHVNGSMNNLQPLFPSDIAKAAYALKSERWTRSCTGDVDVYRTCGTFKWIFVLPFGILAMLVVVVWGAVTCLCRAGTIPVPNDAKGWWEQAYHLAGRRDRAECDGDVDMVFNSKIFGADVSRSMAKPA